MRLFTTEVINQTIQGTTPIVSASEFRELLGRADVLSIELEVTQASGTITPTVTVEVAHSNSGRQFDGHSTPLSNQSLATIPITKMMAAGTEANPLGNLVEILVKLGDANDVAQVRVVVTGRSW